MSRTKSVLLRLTEEEHSRLKELAGREPVSAYLRRVALGTEITIDSSIIEEARKNPPDPSWAKIDPPPQRLSQPVEPIPTQRFADAEEHRKAMEEGRPVNRGTPLPATCKCPVSSCDYRARSLAARCPRHGRLVVPA
jgi:hypothetical protein